MQISYRKFCKLSNCLTILITGAKSGIGYEITRILSSKHHKIIMADKEDLSDTIKTIKTETENENIVGKFVDFTVLSSVKCLANEIMEEQSNLNVLINNAGVFCLGKERTIDGLVPAMQVNHFGPFLLTFLLLDLLEKNKPSRVIFTSSTGAFLHNLTKNNLNNPFVTKNELFSSLFVYYNSKLCNMISANQFSQKYTQKTGVTFNSYHPGMTSTELLVKECSSFKFATNFFLQDPARAALNAAFLATSQIVQEKSGKFFVDFVEHAQPQIINNANFCNEIFNLSKCFVGLHNSN